jgi:hypothetical protein
MKVTLTESGGWANVRKSCTVETGTLPQETAHVLEQALCSNELFADHDGAPDARDARIVVIEVHCGGDSRRTAFSEAATPVSARRVLEILRPLCQIVPAGL